MSGCDFMGTLPRAASGAFDLRVFHLQGICDARLSNVAAPARILTLSHAGQFEVDLTECLDGKVKRLWRTLQPRTEKDEVSGDVEASLAVAL